MDASHLSGNKSFAAKYPAAMRASNTGNTVKGVNPPAPPADVSEEASPVERVAPPNGGAKTRKASAASVLPAAASLLRPRD